MSKKDKLVKRLLEMPKDFTFDEMESLLSYNNFNGAVEYSEEDKCLYGKVVGIKSLLSYEGDSVQELEKDFQNLINGYIAYCREKNVEPEQSYKGSFNVRISPEFHRNIALYAIEHGKSLNAAVEEAILPETRR